MSYKIEKLLKSIDNSLPRPLNYDSLYVSKERAKEIHGIDFPEYEVVIDKDELGKLVVSVNIDNEKYTLFIQESDIYKTLNEIVENI